MDLNDLNKTGLSSLLKKRGHMILLALIALLSFGLNFYAVSKLGYCNAYYAAAIKSMTQSFHNFFFVSFDPAGVVSVDKPPLGLWIQALFVLVFGYHGWAMLLPQALAGTGACLMMYLLTSRYFGRAAGLTSALVFALTPAVAVASRNNTMDMQLIFVLLVAARFLFRSLETGKWRWLFLCALFVGLGFNIKMLQAYMILPAVVIVYLIFAKERFFKRVAAGALSLVILAAVSFAWVAAVDLTPAGSRPYVGSSSNNTVLQLIVGHNGAERLFGSGRGGGGLGGNMPSGGLGGTNPGGGGQNGNFGAFPGQNLGGSPSGAPDQNGVVQIPEGSRDGSLQAAPDGRAGGVTGGRGFSGGANLGGGNFGGGQAGRQGGGGNEIGTPGVLRLWGTSLYGQASWLILLALFCILVRVKKFGLKNLNVKSGVFLFWIVWLVTMYAFFSFAGFWHRYYLCMFAPGVAGLVGIGFPELVRAFREDRSWRRFLLPAGFVCTFAVAFRYVWSYPSLRPWLAPLMLVPAVLSLALMALHYFWPKRLIALAASGLMLFSLLAAPFYWSLTVVLYVEQNSTLPYAGPELASTEEIRGMTPNQEVLTTGDAGTAALEEYLVSHYKEGTYLVVSQRANDVAQFIVDTGLPAVAYGGFLGSDNAITLEKLKQLVSEGAITYFMLGGQGGANSELASYVRENATLIDSSEYLGTDSRGTAGNSGNGVSGVELYLFK